MPKKEKAFSELSKEEQRKRASAALQTAQTKAFAAKKGSPEAEGHFKARAAADRVLSRLKGEAPSREAVTKPGKTKKKGKSTSGSRRRPFEKILPGDPVGKLQGVNDLIKAGQRNKSK